MAEAIITTEDDNSIVSENSFVILGKGSFPIDMNEGGSETINSPTFSLTNDEPQENGSNNGDLGAGNSLLPDTSSVGIHLKLDKLVKENLLLKETLNQSNLAMKKQFDTLALWHEEVVKTHESHKQKFQETQDQILKLKNENIKLKKLIQRSLDRCYGNDSSLYNMDIGQFWTSMDPDVDSDDDEDDELELYYRQAKMETQGMLDGIMQEKCDLEKQLSDALKEIDNLKREIEGLKTKIYADGQNPGNLTSSNASDGDNEKSIINKLSKSVEAELVMKASKQDFMELKKQFEEQSMISNKNSEKLETMIMLYDEMKVEKDKLNYLLEQSKSIARGLTDRISSLNAEIRAKDEELKRKDDEYDKVKRELQKMVLDTEEVAILKAQIELYQNDFNEERKAREQAITEKENMAEQVRFLERTLSDFKKREKENEKKASPSAPKEEKDTRTYMCPRCTRRLPTLTECESHVEACLDLDMFP